MDLEDLPTGGVVRCWHVDEPVEPARSQDCRIDNVRPIAGPYHDHVAHRDGWHRILGQRGRDYVRPIAGPYHDHVDQGFDAIHLCEQLADHTLRRTAVTKVRSPPGGDRVQFVKEDDGRGGTATLLEDLTDSLL